MVEVPRPRGPDAMFPAIAIASNALAVQSQRLGEIATAVAATGATSNGDTTMRNTPTSPVRIGSLPVGDTVENMASLKEVELAYRMNLAVISTAYEMMDSLLDVVQPNKRS